MSATDAPGTCHLVGCPGKGTHPPHGLGHQVGCLVGCCGTWPGGQPYHVKGCPNDESRMPPPPEPAKVLVDQADVVHLLDEHRGPCPSRLDNSAGQGDADLFHRLSRALAVARNTTTTTIPPTLPKEAV